MSTAKHTRPFGIKKDSSGHRQTSTTVRMNQVRSVNPFDHRKHRYQPGIQNDPANTGKHPSLMSVDMVYKYPAYSFPPFPIPIVSLMGT